jgi:hypothetical protein
VNSPKVSGYSLQGITSQFLLLKPDCLLWYDVNLFLLGLLL